MGVPGFIAETASIVWIFRRIVNGLAKTWLFLAFSNAIHGKKRGTPVGG